MQELYEAAYQQASFEPHKNNTYAVAVRFTFPTAASDIDGPFKRTIDAVFRGLRAKIDHPSVNDARIVRAFIDKKVGTPATDIDLYLIEKEDQSCLERLVTDLLICSS